MQNTKDYLEIAMRKNKSRSLDSVRFGIEIEVEFPEKKDSSALIAKHRIIRGWSMDYDGCFDKKTLILTNVGWKYFKDLDKNDKVLSMNSLTQESKYCDIKKLYNFDYKHEMYTIENNRLSISITPNHYLFARLDKNRSYDYFKIEDIYNRHNFKNQELRIPRTFKWKGNWSEYKNITIEGDLYKNSLTRKIEHKKYNISIQSWAKFMGYYLSEGYINKNNATITITQAVGSKYNNSIRNVMRCLPFKSTTYLKIGKRINEQNCYHYNIHDRILVNELIKFGTHSFNKRVPQYIKEWNPKYIEMFLTAYAFGDGHLKSTNTWSYTTTSEQMALDLQELILKTNRYASISKRSARNERHSDIYIVNVYNKEQSEHIALVQSDLKKVDYNDKVYCVETEPYNLVYVMREGSSYWSRNSLDNGCEYRPKDKNKLYLNEDSIDQIKEIIGLIKAHRGAIRPTCGLHIHVDMSTFQNKEIVSIIKAFLSNQKHLYRRFKVLKSREEYTTLKIPQNTFKHLTEENIRKIKKDSYGYDSDVEYFSDRHFGLNIKSLPEHGTLEFRLFNGTIQASKIKEYVTFVITFCLKNARGK